MQDNSQGPTPAEDFVPPLFPAATPPAATPPVTGAPPGANVGNSEVKKSSNTWVYLFVAAIVLILFAGAIGYFVITHSTF